MMKPKAHNPGDIGLLEFLEDIIGTSRYVNLIDKFSKDIDDLSEIKQQKFNRLKIVKNELDQLEDVKNTSTEYYKKEKQYYLLLHLDLLLRRHEINKSIFNLNDSLASFENRIHETENKKKFKLNQENSTIEEVRKIKNRIQILQDEINKKNSNIDELNENDAVKRSEVDNYSKGIKKIEAQLDKLQKNYSGQSENIIKANNDLPEKEKELNQLKDNLSSI